MKLNVEQMKEKFGVSYSVDIGASLMGVCKIKEIFNIQINPHNHCLDTPEIALEKLNKILENEKNKEIEYLEKQKDIFRKSGFLIKNGWRIQNKRFSFKKYIDERKENVEKNYLKNKDNTHFEYIDPKKIFNVPDTKGIKASSVVYLVADSESSQISMGVYEGKVVDFYYFMRSYDSGSVDISGSVEVKTSKDTQSYGIKSNNGEIEINRMGITLFTNLEDAVIAHEKNMKELQAQNEVRLNNIRMNENSSKLKP